MKIFMASAAAFLALSACTFGNANWHSINRQFNPATGDSRLIDAKQRAIIAINRPVLDKDGFPTGGSTPIVCAEPSPDALQATAAALSGAGSLDSGEVAAALQAALSTSESASSFGLRTQSIQLLRDSYYRLCEAYLNDGIDSIAYDILQRRFQNHIIALLAIEQLTGVVRGGQARLSSTAAADSGANIGAIAQALENQRAALATAEAAKGKADSAVINATKRSAQLEGEIQAHRNDLATTPTAGATEDETKAFLAERKRLEGLIELKTAERKGIDETLPNLTTAREEAAQQVIFHQGILAQLTETFKDVADETATAVASAIASGTDTTGGRQNLEPEVVNTIRAITLNAMNQDYESQVCFEALRVKNYSGRYKDVQSLEDVGGRWAAFKTYCEEIFGARVQLSKARAGAVESRSELIATLVNAIAAGKKGVETAEVIDLILALDFSAPVDNVTRFLAQDINFGSDGDGGNTQVTVKVIPAHAPAHAHAPPPAVALAPAGTGASVSEQDFITRLRSVTTTEAIGTELRPVCEAGTEFLGGECVKSCSPYEERQGGACVSICGDGKTFDKEQAACVASS